RRRGDRATMAEQLMAGAHRTDVTPPVGIDIAGFCLRGESTGIHQPLSIRAAVFSASTGTVALVSCELVGLTVPCASELRTAIAEALSIPVLHVYLGCTHTHSGPPLVLELKTGGHQEEWTELNDAYRRLFRFHLLSTVRQARDAMVPVRSEAS